MAPKYYLSLRNGRQSKRLGSSYFQILGTGMDIGEPPSVLLFFDNKRLLFNTGEGIQRFCIEHKVKLSRIEHVLFTRVSPETTGGLFGMLLTLAGELRLTASIWGPPGLQHLQSALRTYLPYSATMHTHVIGSEVLPDAAVILDEDVVKVYGVPLQSSESADKERSNSVVMVYVCQLPDVPGKFDPAKAASLGVKAGKKYSELQDGKTVESDDGLRTIHPSDVIEPCKPGPVFIIVDCPTVSHVSALLSATALRKFNSQNLSCIVHLSPMTVIKETSYRMWMASFGSVQQILAGPGCYMSSPVFHTSALMLTKLNLISPRIFPMDLRRETAEEDVSFLFPTMKTAAAYNLLKFQLHPLPLLGLDKTCRADELNLDAVRKDFASELKQVSWTEASDSSDVQSTPPCITGRKDEMELVFLGTGSSHPSCHRNVSAIYLHLFQRGGMLLDCGEDTLGQLIRRYGHEEAEAILINLKCIWISHIHADHQSGLARVLSTRRALLQSQGKLEPLLLIAPAFLRRFLAPYESLEDLSVRFLDCSQTTQEAAETISQSSEESRPGKRKYTSGESGCDFSAGVDEAGLKKLSETLADMKLKFLLSVPVIHCARSYAVVLEAEGEPGWKLAYSGDTRPCEEFVEASRGATVFIHEATFDDELLEDALEKKHSLTSEAVQAGAAAGAYRTILTHFSQRYPRVPVFNESYNDSTCVAFDMMTVNLADLPMLPKLVPAFKLVFKEETVPDDP